jgi:hypothetical protein
VTGRVKLVLDVTAIHLYATGGSVDVGDLIEQIVDEGNLVAVPALAAATVAASVKDDGLLHLLTGHPHIVVEPAGEWRSVGDYLRVYGDLVTATTAQVADAHRRAYVVTTDPDRFEPLPTIEVG